MAILMMVMMNMAKLYHHDNKTTSRQSVDYWNYVKQTFKGLISVDFGQLL